MTPPSSVLIVEDHPLMSGAVGAILSEVAPTARVEFATTLAEALETLARSPVDLVVLDLGLTDTVGFSGLAQIRSLHPDIPVVVDSAQADIHTVLRSIDAGACGFIPKTFDATSFRDAFRTILSGNVYIPPLIYENTVGNEPAPEVLRTTRAAEDLDLSPRQLEILGLIITGLPNKLVARRLDIAVGTVKTHVSALLAKLGARNRTEALLVVSQIGWSRIAQRYGQSSPSSPTSSSPE